MAVLGPDVSFWQDDDNTVRKIDFLKMKNKDVEFVIIRAGQGNGEDSDFDYNWSGAKNVGIPRGPYFFYDSRVHPVTQAEKFISVLGNDLGELPLFGDFEENYGGPYSGWKNFKLFLERLEEKVAELGGHEIGIYTGPYYWKEHTVGATEEDFAYFKKFPLWIAHYGVTTPMIPYPWASDGWTFWQFTDKGDGFAYGAESHSIDLNTFNGTPQEYRLRFHLPGIIIPDVFKELHSIPHPDVYFDRVYRYGSWCSIRRIFLFGTLKARVTKFGLRTVSQRAQELSARFVTNGGDFTPYHATGKHVADGVIYQLQSEYEPWLNLPKEGGAQINTYDSRIPPYNAIALKRFIVQNGAVAPNHSAAWYEVHPRTLYGVSKDGSTLITAVIDGRQEPFSRGVNLFEGAEIMIEFGAWTAGDGDGGGSSADSQDWKITNSPIENGVPGLERPVGDCVYITETETASVIWYDTPELWRLKSVVDVQYTDQTDIDQMGCGFAPVMGGFSGVSNWIELNQAEMNLIEKVNTGLDDVSWLEKRQYACKDTAGYIWQYMTTTPFAAPWHAWNIVIGSKLPYGSDWNIVKVLGRSSNGYYFIEGIPANSDLTSLSRETHPWLFHRVNVTSAQTRVSTDTPKKRITLPIFSPIGRRHASGDVLASGIWIKPEYLHSKVTEVPPVGTEFDIRILGVPKLFGYNPLNIRYEPNFGDIGENNTIAYCYRYSIWTVDEVQTSANGDIWYRINKRGNWLCAYQASKGRWYVEKV